MDLYRSLKSTIAKRMLRFLDKRFYHRARWEFPLVEFACEHIGLGRCYDVGQLKRRLSPGIVELEEAGVIGQLATSSRFARIGRGNWLIVFAKGDRRHVRREPDSLATIVKELTDRGITPRVASRLSAQFPEKEIAAQLMTFDELIRNQDPRVSRNPAGFLVASIRQEYGLSTKSAARSPATRHSRKRPQLTRKGLRPAAQNEADIDANQRIDRFLAGLSLEERDSLERDAECLAPAFLRDGYCGASTNGQAAVGEVYRSVMIRQHVLRLLESADDSEKG
jgi:hypothetical protein